MVEIWASFLPHGPHHPGPWQQQAQEFFGQGSLAWQPYLRAGVTDGTVSVVMCFHIIKGESWHWNSEAEGPRKQLSPTYRRVCWLTAAANLEEQPLAAGMAAERRRRLFGTSAVFKSILWSQHSGDRGRRNRGAKVILRYSTCLRTVQDTWDSCFKNQNKNKRTTIKTLKDLIISYLYCSSHPFIKQA